MSPNVCAGRLVAYKMKDDVGFGYFVRNFYQKWQVGINMENDLLQKDQNMKKFRISQQIEVN